LDGNSHQPGTIEGGSLTDDPLGDTKKVIKIINTQQKNITTDNSTATNTKQKSAKSKNSNSKCVSKSKNTKKDTKKDNAIWVLLVTIISFLSTAILTIFSSNLLKRADLAVAFLVVIVIILINVIADVIGTAVTAADATPFHAMAAKKVYGAKRAIKLIRSADKVANVCNDVIGDICGVISGAAGTYIIVRLAAYIDEITVVELILTGLIAAFTVGGKALGKIIAISNSNFIIYRVSVIMQFITGGFDKNNSKRDRKTNEYRQNGSKKRTK
jgi:Mg2+/Co2+ transporter CorB